MTNEQLAELIQEGNDELKPVLWERVKKLLYMFSGRYYSRFTEYCDRCGVTEWDLKQQAYSAYEISLKGYISERGSFSTYLTFGFKKVLRELFKSKDPLNSAESIDRSIDEDNENSGSVVELVSDQNAVEAFENIENEDVGRIVRTAVNGLPEREQATIRAIYFENKKNKEVAEIYGVTSQAVAEYSKRALMMLRRNKEIRRLSDELGYGSQLTYRNTLGSYKHFGISGVERVAIERADIESRLITASETMRKNDYQ